MLRSWTWCSSEVSSPTLGCQYLDNQRMLSHLVEGTNVFLHWINRPLCSVPDSFHRNDANEVQKTTKNWFNFIRARHIWLLFTKWNVPNHNSVCLNGLLVSLQGYILLFVCKNWVGIQGSLLPVSVMLGGGYIFSFQHWLVQLPAVQHHTLLGDGAGARGQVYIGLNL